MPEPSAGSPIAVRLQATFRLLAELIFIAACLIVIAAAFANAVGPR